MIYAGIGSRNTPAWVCEIFIRMGTWLAKRGDLLRSGHADGADFSFEQGCDKVSGKKEIYLPWKGFNGSNSCLCSCSENAYKLAAKYHPAWDKCGEAAQKLMARNGYQVLGSSLEEPVDFIVCWTQDGKLQGETAQALRIAKDYQIPIFNAGNYENEKDLIDAFNTFYFSLEKQQDLDLSKGQRMLKYQEDLSKKYKYKPLKEEMRNLVRNIYASTIPEYFTRPESSKLPLHSPTGELLAKGYDRIVIGDYGAFIEIDPKDICMRNIYIPQKQRYRIDDPHYAEHVKYLWYEPKSGYATKIYDQLRTVTYADYQANKWYISPYETKEGYLKENDFCVPKHLPLTPQEWEAQVIEPSIGMMER